MLAVSNGTPQCLSRNGEVPWDFTSGTTIPRQSGTLEAAEATAWTRRVLETRRGAIAEPVLPTRMARAPRPLAAGHRLGPYRLLERLGQGAQGEVWKALRLEPHRELVALKILRSALSSNPARMAQFRREAERGVRLAGVYKLFRGVDTSTVMPTGYCVILYDLPREPKSTKTLKITGFLRFCTT